MHDPPPLPPPSPAAFVVRILSLATAILALAMAAHLGLHPRPPTAVSLARPGRSTDLVCRLAQQLDRTRNAPVPRREAGLTVACPHVSAGSRARVVPVGDDRRRAVVLRAHESLHAEIEPGHADRLRFWAAVRGQGDELDVRVTLGAGPEARTWVRRVANRDGWVGGELEIPERTTRALPLTIEMDAPRPRDRDARLALAAPRLITRPDPAMGGAPNVVLYLIDTLRADHTPTYGYSRPTMPRLAALAREGVVFDHAYSTAARTRPATASVLTGLFPSRHHARLGRGIDLGETTLAEALREHGWSTWAYVANGNVFAPGFAFEQGFDQFRTIRGRRHDNHARTGEINDVLLPELRERADEPFFLYVHAIDPHSPYDPPSGFAGAFRDPAYAGEVSPANTHSRDLEYVARTELDVQHARDLYDEDLLYQDAMFGRLLDTLDDAGVLDRTLIVVVADHGDEFHEHGGWEHGNRLFEHQIRIPFVVRLPGGEGGAGRRVATPVSLADVTPTVLGLYGLPSPPGVQGRDLSTVLLDTNADPRAQPQYAEEVTNVPGGDLRTLIDGPWKLIRRANGPRDDELTSYQLFRLDEDPAEQRDRAAAEPERVRRMRAELLARSRSVATPLRSEAAIAVDPKTRRQLRALGYLDGE